jgi:hypothetical protein
MPLMASETREMTRRRMRKKMRREAKSRWHFSV